MTARFRLEVSRSAMRERSAVAALRADWMVTALCSIWLVAVAFWRGDVREPAAAPIADSATSLDQAVRRIAACLDGCAGVLYVWSERMPLSKQGIAAIASVTDALGVGLTLIETEAVRARAAAPPGADDAHARLVDTVLGSGALAHAPALVVHAGGRVLGPAILGYKRSEAYEAAIRRRLAAGAGASADRPDAAARTGALDRTEAARGASAAPFGGRIRADYEAVGSPGAYFRWVPGRGTLAYESARRIWLLDLGDAENREAPGFIDFVPTPDGRFFVTPGPRNQGLELYEADEVFEAAGTRRATAVEPFFVDRSMRDQYPSIGILERSDGRTVYRVLTSWFEGIVYRDYEIETDEDGAHPRARALGDPVVPCEGRSISIPIMSQDGREVAARDEATGTTKVFRMEPRGRCTEVIDLGVQTGKVAWHHTGRLLAFGRPRLRTARGDEAEAAVGIFVYDRQTGRAARVSDSERASTLAFPDFVGDSAIAFLVPGRGEPSVFRIVEGLRSGGAF